MRIKVSCKFGCETIIDAVPGAIGYKCRSHQIICFVEPVQERGVAASLSVSKTEDESSSLSVPANLKESHGEDH